MLVSACPAIAKFLAKQVRILDPRNSFLIYPESSSSPRRRLYEPEARIQYHPTSSNRMFMPPKLYVLV